MRPAAGERILLCRDGPTEMEPHDQIVDVLKSCYSVEAAARQLIDRAGSAAGRDDITVLLRVVMPPPKAWPIAVNCLQAFNDYKPTSKAWQGWALDGRVSMSRLSWLFLPAKRS